MLFSESEWYESRKAHRDVPGVGSVLELQGALEVGNHLKAADVDPSDPFGADGAVHDGDHVDGVEAEGDDEVRLPLSRAEVVSEAEEGVHAVGNFRHRVTLKQQLVHYWKWKGTPAALKLLLFKMRKRGRGNLTCS